MPNKCKFCEEIAKWHITSTWAQSQDVGSGWTLGYSELHDHAYVCDIHLMEILSSNPSGGYHLVYHLDKKTPDGVEYEELLEAAYKAAVEWNAQ